MKTLKRKEILGLAMGTKEGKRKELGAGRTCDLPYMCVCLYYVSDCDVCVCVCSSRTCLTLCVCGASHSHCTV